MRLNKRQRNQMFEAVADGGLDPAECTFVSDDTETRITHRLSGSYLQLTRDDQGQVTATTVVGDGPPSIFRPFLWSGASARARDWAVMVKDDAATPDLWADLQSQRGVITGVLVDDGDDTPFTADEQVEIAEQLRQIQALVAEKFAGDEADRRAMAAGFAHLEAMVRTEGRKAFRVQLFALLFALIASGILPPEVVHDILAAALHGLGHFFGGGSPPPQVPPTT